MKPYSLDNNHRIDGDSLQWMLQERTLVGKGRYKWKNIGYYTKLNELMRAYSERFERLHGGTLPKVLVDSKRASDLAWEAVDRMISRHPEVETLREQIGRLEESLQAYKRRGNG